MNIDTLKADPLSNKYLSIRFGNGFISFVNKPTREEFLQDKLCTACLDHIHVKGPALQVDCCIATYKVSDHYLVACLISQNSEIMANETVQVIECFDRKGYEKKVVRKLQEIIQEENIDSDVERFCKKITDCIQETKHESTSLKKFSRNSRGSKPWINSEILTLRY